MDETIFVKRPKFLAATSNLRVEQNLAHLGRFLHFSQKCGWSDLNFKIKIVIAHCRRGRLSSFRDINSENLA